MSSEPGISKASISLGKFGMPAYLARHLVWIHEEDELALRFAASDDALA